MLHMYQGIVLLERIFLKAQISCSSKLTTSPELLLCSHSPNDVPPEPQRNVSIAAVRGAVRPSKSLEFETFRRLNPNKCPGGVVFCKTGRYFELKV